MTLKIPVRWELHDTAVWWKILKSLTLIFKQVTSKCNNFAIIQVFSIKASIYAYFYVVKQYIWNVCTMQTIIKKFQNLLLKNSRNVKSKSYFKRYSFSTRKESQAFLMHLCCPYLATFKTNFLKTYLTI